MFKNSKNFKNKNSMITIGGLILLLVIGLLASTSWTTWQKLEKREEGSLKETSTITFKDLTDEEFLNELREIVSPAWRICYFSGKKEEKFVLNPSFKELLKLELNFTSEQLEKFQEFLGIVTKWNLLEGEISHQEYLLKYVKLNETQEKQIKEKVELLKKEAFEKKNIIKNNLSKIRKILNDKERQFLEWAEEIREFYRGLLLVTTPRPDSLKEFNSIKNSFFEREWYIKKLEEKSSKFLESLKALNLTSSQKAEIKNIVKDFIKRIDDLKAQLYALYYIPYIKKSENEIIEEITQLIKERNKQIKTHLTKDQILKFDKFINQ